MFVEHNNPFTCFHHMFVNRSLFLHDFGRLTYHRFHWFVFRLNLIKVWSWLYQISFVIFSATMIYNSIVVTGNGTFWSGLWFTGHFPYFCYPSLRCRETILLFLCKSVWDAMQRGNHLGNVVINPIHDVQTFCIQTIKLNHC